MILRISEPLRWKFDVCVDVSKINPFGHEELYHIQVSCGFKYGTIRCSQIVNGVEFESDIYLCDALRLSDIVNSLVKFISTVKPCK